MKMQTWGWVSLISLCLVALAVSTQLFAVSESEFDGGCNDDQNGYCVAKKLNPLSERLHTLSMPKLATPAWLVAPEPSSQTVAYSIETRGTLSSDIDEFASFAASTLNDSRGWARLGILFKRVENDGDFVLVLSQASEVPSFAPGGCDSTYSCNVGDFVIINEDRWKAGTPSYNQAGASLETYRQMVINHETGHWLGHGHTSCQADDDLATVMQQQSISLQGCEPNAWPLASELYAPNLGIRS